jgi:8-oxo-dGTP diphosphatase
MKSIEVVAAIICFEDKYLCLQRGSSKLKYISEKYEFPGGKIEAGESQSDAIVREINEELHLTLTEPEFLMTVEHQYPDFFITMHAFLCHFASEPTPVLTEHIDAKWLSKGDLLSLDWAAADIPIVNKLIE